MSRNRVWNITVRTILIWAEVHIGDRPPTTRLSCAGKVVQWTIDAMVAVLTAVPDADQIRERI